MPLASQWHGTLTPRPITVIRYRNSQLSLVVGLQAECTAGPKFGELQSCGFQDLSRAAQRRQPSNRMPSSSDTGLGCLRRAFFYLCLRFFHRGQNHSLRAIADVLPCLNNMPYARNLGYGNDKTDAMSRSVMCLYSFACSVASHIVSNLLLAETSTDIVRCASRMFVC